MLPSDALERSTTTPSYSSWRAPSLVARAETRQERRPLGILPGRILCAGILHGRTLCACALRSPDLFSEVLRAYLCPCVAGGPDLSALLHEPMRCLNILRSRRWNIFLNVCQRIL